MTRTPPVQYKNLLQDNARWEEIELREGDIIVTTPPKCGTTWTQIICGLLVFGQPQLPKPLDELSYWVDAYWHTVDDIKAALEAQEHRRFLKSHTPIDGLPFDERVTYISVGRDTRDAGISMDFHMANMNWERVMEIRAATMPPEEVEFMHEMPEPAPTLHERFWSWAESDDVLIGLEGMLRHVNGFWDKRDEPNVLLLHYAEMKEDLEGQMRRIAAALGIDIPESDWPKLVEAATFDRVRAKSETLAPENTIWKDKTEFFRKGSNGQWQDLFDEADLERYRARIAELTTPEISEWLHRGPV